MGIRGRTPCHQKAETRTSSSKVILRVQFGLHEPAGVFPAFVWEAKVLVGLVGEKDWKIHLLKLGKWQNSVHCRSVVAWWIQPLIRNRWRFSAKAGVWNRENKQDWMVDTLRHSVFPLGQDYPQLAVENDWRGLKASTCDVTCCLLWQWPKCILTRSLEQSVFGDVHLPNDGLSFGMQRSSKYQTHEHDLMKPMIWIPGEGGKMFFESR